ncbi:variant erythrocyte surface antigen-1 [Babesia bovis T2Bo]|uniref:variant erythrocyte surface antigen-1 n=1 Tax=Babesia bovis T2Bo TaxID=484906 RepID=UPI001C344FDF|nr:variant erythrocyte surface antigen-1 [Babesia bovis T2Bo]EDO08272.2 variant erythrocyte surface antigen-1 [Babesia bovis T2Bo]
MAAQCSAGSVGAAGKKCLTQCPTNVKEAIDWVICMTGNDGCHCQKPQTSGSPGECVTNVAKEVETLILQFRKDGDTSIKNGWPDIELLMNSDSGSGEISSYIEALIKGLGEKLSKFLGCINCTPKSCGKCPSGAAYKKRCAKILLGCIPLIFSCLTYLYWNCSDNAKDRNWKDCNLNSGLTDALCTYLAYIGFDNTQLNKCNGSVINTLLDCFKELKDCIAGKKSTSQGNNKPKTYAEFVNEIHTAFSTIDQEEETRETQEKKQAEGKEMPLQRLYMGSSSYFQASQEKHNQTADEAKRPESICELLYWLLGLPYTPVGVIVGNGSLGALLGIEDEASGDDGVCGYLPSGKCCPSPPTTTECPMSNDTADYYLLPPCYYSAFVLLSIQGKLVSGKNANILKNASSGEIPNQTPEPFLHDLYANQHFKFYYPSSARSWVVMVWDVVYALYFQLGFLYKQCQVNYKDGYGWKDCAYGKGVKCVESKTWICTNTKSPGAQHDQCGKDPNKSSPLQGYLCDKLTDFKCENNDDESEPKSYCAHLKHVPPSQWCPIPMGFLGNLETITPERKGEHLSVILSLYFENKTDGASLYQLVLFLGIGSLRTPRCLGDMFAFFCGVGGLCDDTPLSKDSSLVELWKEKITGYPGTPNPEKITKSLKTLAGCCTQTASIKDTCDSLCSLSPADISKCSSCTKYLCSISWSVYTVFATRHIECYLSWVIYMIEDFQSNLEAFLKYFEDVDCNHGCPGCLNGQKCHKINNKGGCQCNVVECKRILGALYRFGFTYQEASTLQSDKKCSDFLQQLKEVADGKPLKDLIKAVNQILYSIRLAFIFWAWLLWTVAIVYLIFGLVVDLDILHIRSHIWLKHTHNIPAFNLFAARRLKYGIQVYFGR